MQKAADAEERAANSPSTVETEIPDIKYQYKNELFVLITFAASDKHHVSSLQFAAVINCRTESDGCAAWSRPSTEKHILSTCFSSSRCDIFNVFITLCAKEKLCHGPGFCFVGLEFRLQVFEEFISV